jgi:long-chain acyl-CoA synthetase
VTIVDRIREAAASRPAQPALLVDRGGTTETVSYAELVGGFEAVAKRLREAGVAPGDRCGLAARQGRGFVELALGILAADACLVPVPDEPSPAALDAFAARARLHHGVVETEPDFELHRFAPPPPADGAGDAAFRALRPAYLRFTSGTTSRRKGVILGHDRILERTAAANRALRIGPADRVLWLLPMAHHFVVSILLYLRQGASILLPAGPLARPILELAARERATLIYASPHHYRLLAKDTSGLALPDVRLAISTAEGLRADTARAFRQRFGHPVAQALGIIEVGLPVANLHAAAEKPEALGRPLPDYTVWLRGEDGREVTGTTSPERTGEICIRGPGMLDAYLDPWLPAAVVLEPDGFRTGDQGWFDPDGNLFLAGRRANRISMAGMKFFGEEVEAVLDAHPGVRESRVLGREHAQLGEIPVAEVVPADPAHPPDPRELTRHCRAALPGYKVPREFRFVSELPRTSSGKVRRSGAGD